MVMSSAQQVDMHLPLIGCRQKREGPSRYPSSMNASRWSSGSSRSTTPSQVGAKWESGFEEPGACLRLVPRRLSKSKSLRVGGLGLVDKGWGLQPEREQGRSKGP